MWLNHTKARPSALRGLSASDEEAFTRVFTPHVTLQRSSQGENRVPKSAICLGSHMLLETKSKTILVKGQPIPPPVEIDSSELALQQAQKFRGGAFHGGAE